MRVLATALLFTLVACAAGREARDPERDPWASDDAMLEVGARYIDDAAFRRKALETSLTNPDNTYSRQRLTSYGLGTQGWDVLPVWNPRSVVLTRAQGEAFRAGAPLVIDPATPPLWNGTRPSTMAEWVALGREAFFRYPLRKEAYLEWAVTRTEDGRFGVRSAPDGTYPGIVAFVDTSGRNTVGMTCAMCHSDVGDSGVVVGRARRVFDYGALRLAFDAANDVDEDPALARRMQHWGPGRADVTEDDEEDPVAIPDLWGLRYQRYLTQAGSITQVTPASLAIRQETQLLTSNHQTVRPPREIAFALAMFIYSLTPPPRAPQPSTDASLAVRGKMLFAAECAGCHSNGAFGGNLVRVDLVDTDPALANGPARGTGRYRPAALLDVTDRAPYFHHGAIPTLADVLSPERFAATYQRGTLGPGAVSGHPFGTELSENDRAALVAYLETL
jgi:mono/diheme cytochrome c family protein